MFRPAFLSLFLIVTTCSRIAILFLHYLISIYAIYPCKTAWKNKKITLRSKIVILKAAVMAVVKYGSEAWVLLKTEEDLDKIGV